MLQLLERRKHVLRLGVVHDKPAANRAARDKL